MGTKAYVTATPEDRFGGCCRCRKDTGVVNKKERQREKEKEKEKGRPKEVEVPRRKSTSWA